MPIRGFCRDDICLALPKATGVMRQQAGDLPLFVGDEASIPLIAATEAHSLHSLLIKGEYQEDKFYSASRIGYMRFHKYRQQYIATLRTAAVAKV